MDVEKYLARIGCSPPWPLTLEALGRLHLNHLLSVPFEDLSIHSGEKIHLHLPSIYQKIVSNRRGGFCYENNGLFSWLLDGLGFQVEIVAAQVGIILISVHISTLVCVMPIFLYGFLVPRLLARLTRNSNNISSRARDL